MGAFATIADVLPIEAPNASVVELARGVAEGDREAEAELYRRLAPRVRLYGLKHLRDGAAADDLAQDVLLLTLEKLRRGEVRDTSRLASFVLGTCRRVVAELHRGSARRRGLLERFGHVLAPTEPDQDEPEPEDLARMADCLERLAERERTIVVLSFSSERDSREIGRDLGMTPSNVRVVRHRAISRLRSCFGEER